MTMDPSLYKDLSIDDLQYHYHYHPAKSAGLPTLLFLHGFPSTSGDWVCQVVYFSSKGYGVVAPDMLGYGGTSKPVDVEPFVATSLATHCMAILDTEGIQKALVVSHDWGAAVASRLANLWPERHLGTVFIAAPYSPPDPTARSGESKIQFAKEKIGIDLFSYWRFFASDEAPRIISEHEESFYSVIFTSEHALWGSNVSPEGALEKWLLEDKKAPLAAWAPNKGKFMKSFKDGGWRAPTNWYRSLMQGRLAEGDKDIPQDSYKLTLPVLVVATLHDAICVPKLARDITAATCTNATVRDIDSGHWAMLEKPDEINALIDEFLTGL